MIEKTIDDAGTLATFKVTGEVHDKAMKSALDSFYRGQTTTKVLWDFREAVVSDIENPDVRGVAEYVKRNTDAKGDRKAALVFSKEGYYGLGRMFEMLSESMQSPLQIKAFQSLDDAYRWLEIER